MKKIKIMTETKETEVIDKLWCNKCGYEFTPDQIFYGHYAEFKVHWGFGSPKDGIAHESYLCESCYDKFVETFKFPVEIEELW